MRQLKLSRLPATYHAQAGAKKPMLGPGAMLIELLEKQGKSTEAKAVTTNYLTA